MGSSETSKPSTSRACRESVSGTPNLSPIHQPFVRNTGNTMTIRIAVIGAGLMGADHAKIVAEEMQGASLQLVCDMDESPARKVADLYGAAA